MSDHETTLREIGAEELRKLESLPSVTGQPPKSEAAVRFRARHAACLAGADALRRGTWQPIATAPKDGTATMLASASGAWIGYWCPVYTSGYRPDNPWASLMLNHKHMRDMRMGRPRSDGLSPLVPTHWQPLPDAPTEPTR